MIAFPLMEVSISNEPTIVNAFPVEISLEAAVSTQMAFEVINETIRRRRANKRDDVTQTLRAGRYLAHLKTTIPHGQFQKYVLDNTLYKYPREYQIDMQIYQRWKNHISELAELGVIHDLDNPELELIDQMDDEAVEVAATSFLKFASGDMPEWGMEAAVNHIERRVNSDDPNDKIDVLSIREANKLVSAIKAVEAITDNASREVARQLVEDHGVTNTEVLEFIPHVMRMTPNIIEEMQSTGALSVAGISNGEGRQINLDKISKTDLEIASGYDKIEQHLQESAVVRTQIENATHYDWITSLRGTPEQIMAQLTRYLTQADGQYQVKISILTTSLTAS